MARTFYKTANGRFTDAGSVRGDKEGKKANLGFGLKFGTTTDHPKGKYTASQMRKILKEGMIVKSIKGGKVEEEEVTKENKERILTQLTSNEITPESRAKSFLENAGKESGQKASRPSLTVTRGTNRKPVVSTRGSQRGKAPIIQKPLGDAVKEQGDKALKQSGQTPTTSTSRIKLSGGNSPSKGGKGGSSKGGKKGGKK